MSESRRIKWGILGVSSQSASSLVANAIINSATGQLVAAAGASDEELMKFLDALFALNTTLCAVTTLHNTYAGLLANENVEAIFIALTLAEHYEWIIRTMNARKHVFCEAPLVVTEGQMLGIQCLSQTYSDIFCLEALLYQSHPFIKDLKDVICDKKMLGEVRSIHAVYSYDMPVAGGSIHNVGCYPVSLIRYLLGSEPIQIAATGTINPTTHDDDDATLLLTFAGDVKATVQVANNICMSWLFYVVGTGGTLQMMTNPWTPSDQNMFTIRLFDKALSNAATAASCPYLYSDPACALYSYGIDALGESVIHNKLSDRAVSLQHSKGNVRVLQEWRRQVHEPRSALRSHGYFSQHREEKEAQNDSQNLQLQRRM